MYKSFYDSPLGRITLLSDGEFLTHLLLPGQERYLSQTMGAEEKELEIFSCTKNWLDNYFQGKILSLPPISLKGTSFQKEVWNLLLEIPYGRYRTYGEIASKLAAIRKVPRISAQAVGGAISRNPISIIVPCHRVIGANKKLVGYQGGILLKEKLLRMEGGYP